MMKKKKAPKPKLMISTCECCGNTIKDRLLSWDEKLCQTLCWIFEHSIRRGIDSPVGLTKVAARKLNHAPPPDWIIGDRSYPNLVFFGLLQEVGSGTYQLTKKGHAFLSGDHEVPTELIIRPGKGVVGWSDSKVGRWS